MQHGYVTGNFQHNKSAGEDRKIANSLHYLQCGAGCGQVPPRQRRPANCTDIALLIFPPVILLF